MIPRGFPQLVLVSAVVVLVSVGLARGVRLANVHNAALALAFALVGAYVLLQRPGHREGRLFLAAGVVEAAIFLGRQVGQDPGQVRGATWWGWVGVWPVAVALALVTLAVICFPDGRLPSRRWVPVVGAVVFVAAVCAGTSALWPVEYDASGVATRHPLHGFAPEAVADAWGALAHPAYVVFQVLWVVAVVVRWRSSGGQVRAQLTWLVLAAVASLVALAVGLGLGGSPTPGLLATALVPVAAGWAIVHGQHVASYNALTWLSRAPESTGLPTDQARAVAEALGSPRAVLWMGDDVLHALGVWPETDDVLPPTTVSGLEQSGVEVREVVRGGRRVGALSAERPAAGGLSRTEARLFGDLAAQAALVVEHVTLADVVARERTAGHLEVLSPREHDVLDLMARGLSNAAISEELHLSVKSVEPVVSTIFTKLELHADAASNRRVLAVLAYLRT